MTDSLIWLQNFQETVLMMAAKKGMMQIVKTLIQHRASVNFTNEVDQISTLGVMAL